MWLCVETQVFPGFFQGDTDRHQAHQHSRRQLFDWLLTQASDRLSHEPLILQGLACSQNASVFIECGLSTVDLSF